MVSKTCLCNYEPNILLANIFCIYLQTDQYAYSLSYPGIKCRNIVSSEGMCKYATRKIPKSLFTIAIGAGIDLPYGCVWYMCGASQAPSTRCDKIAQRHAVFWNPNGSVSSMDRNIRQVCYEPKDSFKGIIKKYFALKHARCIILQV